MQYFIFRHGKDIIGKARKNQYCLCRYEYGFQEQKSVHNNWIFFKKVKVGDIIILSSTTIKNKKYAYAWGYAIKPRFKKKIKKISLNCDNVINTRKHGEKNEYRSDKYNGYIEFEDCECFYENLEDGKNRFGQRIDIDEWRDYNKEGVKYRAYDKSYKFNTIQEINEEDALNIIRELKNDPNFEFEDKSMENYIELLKSNKNLILTGAPGTGKTHLAKNIASQIILKKDYDESVKNDNDFKEQCAFVQFHPSYDYTDFVEGLRPKNDNGNIGFVRKDGVFKEFCKKALKNLKDSQKDISTLNYDEIIKKYFLEFIDDIQSSIDGNEQYEIKGLKGEPIAPVVYAELKNDDVFYYKIHSKQGNEYKQIEYLNSLIECYKDIIIKNLDKITHKMLSKYTNGLPSSTYGILKAFYDKYNEKIEQEKNNITVQEVKKKDFVFIIDEINRGEISKIFGELFFSVDSGYRGEKGKVLTQYANLIEDGDEFKDGFYIPENVYIIGTMNDIDRSVESMDFAMRRRFAWKEIKAENTQETILSDLGDLKYETIKRMDNLNNVIRDEETNLSEAYCIGAAYFKKIKDYKGDFNKLWDNHLNGLLFEYTRGMSNQKEIMIKLKDAYNSNSDNDTEGEEEEIIEEE